MLRIGNGNGNRAALALSSPSTPSKLTHKLLQRSSEMEKENPNASDAHMNVAARQLSRMTYDKIMETTEKVLKNAPCLKAHLEEVADRAFRIKQVRIY
jgi:hypothetical protein